MNHNELSCVPAALHALDVSTHDQTLVGLLQRATPDEQKAVITAIKIAYQSGQDTSDARCARMMTRIFSSFIGVTPGVDMLDTDVGNGAGSRVRAVVKLLARATLR
jgi:hypothetical protein